VLTNTDLNEKVEPSKAMKPESRSGIRKKERANMKITLSSIVNPDSISTFDPIEGKWDADATSAEMQEAGLEPVVNAIEKHFAPFVVDVLIFHSNGHEITGDFPSCGSFLATRKLK
jgi:hypothetical protein